MGSRFIVAIILFHSIYYSESNWRCERWLSVITLDKHFYFSMCLENPLE